VDLGFIEKGELGKAKKRQSRNRKNVKSADKIFRQQTLESWFILVKNFFYKTANQMAPPYPILVI
jgi:hypothetical protein